MKKNCSKDSRISNLRKGKVKNVGFFEGIKLKTAGRIDGKRGLPRQDNNGHWRSPHIDREIHSYDEFSSRMWGQLQLEEEEEFARLGELMDSVAHLRTQLETAKEELKNYTTTERMVDNTRRHGESKLTEAQVVARRANERAKRVSPLRNRVDSLQAKLVAEIDEFSRVRNKIIEDNNSTRMVCSRVRDHLYQRLAVYWNSALCKHPESNKMPVIPDVSVVFHAEEIYMQPHQILMQKAELLSQILSKDVKGVA